MRWLALQGLPMGQSLVVDADILRHHDYQSSTIGTQWRISHKDWHTRTANPCTIPSPPILLTCAFKDWYSGTLSKFRHNTDWAGRQL